MNTKQGQRIASLFLAAALTALVFGSQLGIAQHYTDQADEQLATKATAPVALQRVPADGAAS